MHPLDDLFQPNPGLHSRSISFENPTGAKGAGGQAASPLGEGRKGDPARVVAAGEIVELADIEGPGTIRHIWMTTRPSRTLMRSAMVRIYWEDQAFPSVELPLGEFFGFAHGSTAAFQSALHSVGERYGMNCFIPMPFLRRARIELANESPKPMTLFYQVDYTLGDAHSPDLGRLHAQFLRANPTVAGVDFELLPRRAGSGRLLGSVMGIRPLRDAWWGEGEIKMYMDGDQRYATIVGTGSEDYVGLSWGIQQTPFLYMGANRVDAASGIETGAVSMYRWHVPDAVFWHEDMRVTIQQIGHAGDSPNLDAYKANLFERKDDWSAATFWYAAQLAPLAPCVPVQARVTDLPPGVDSGSATRQ
jgi:hypothetical protein